MRAGAASGQTLAGPGPFFTVAQVNSSPPPSGSAGPAVAQGPVTVSVVLPAYEVGERLAPTVRGCVAELTDAGVPFELVVVDDGSTDSAPQALPALPGLRVLRQANAGKGAALRAGAAATSGRVVVFLDADGDISPRHLRPLIDPVLAGRAQVAYGDRSGDGRTQSPLRRLSSFGYRMLVRALHRVPVRDTQCGAKAFDGNLIRAAMPAVTQQGFCFDIELLAIVARAGATFEPVPVVVERAGGSTIGLRTVAAMFAQTVALAAHRTPQIRPEVTAPGEGLGVVGVR